MNTQGSMFTDIGFSAGCTKGTIVAYDDALGIYIPAAARWSDDYRQDGSVIPETSSYVLGVLITDVVDNRGTVLCNGWTKDEELIYLMTGGVSGEYYLDTDGKAKPGRSNVTTLPVYCFCYRKSANAGDGGVLVFNPKPPEYAGHSHGHYKLQDIWTVASTGSTLTVPGSSAVYDALTKGSAECFSLVKNGVEVSKDLWSVSVSLDSATISVNFQVLETDEFVLYTITPFTAEEPIVRSLNISKNCKLLKADKNAGNVLLSIDDSAETGKYSGSCVVSLTNGGISTGPVVHQIMSGSGITLAQYTDSDGYAVPGTYVISADEVSHTECDMMLCNLDGAVLGSSSNSTSYVFPKGLTSKIHGTIRAPFIPDVLDPFAGGYVSRSVTGKINIMIRGGSASAQSLSIIVNRVKKPKDGGSSIASNSAEYTLSGSLGADESKVYLLTADIPVTSSDFLTCTLQADKPIASIEVVSISLSLF